MKKITKVHLTIFISFLMLSFSIQAQTITGKVTDESGNGIPFANVIEKGTRNGTTTDEEGKFSLNVEKLPTVLVVSSLGYTTVPQSVSTDAHDVIVILSEQGVGLDEIVITGNRAKPRTILDSPVPIDNIDTQDLQNSGKQTIERMLTFRVPSFNSQNQAISDATAHYDPADLRGLGPSRTLVLVNGKRKNQSAQVYLNRTPGKGEVGIDLKSIPIAAVDHVEVLRDGASAQYGSDAIAGVINMVLKKNVSYSTFNTRVGVTSEGDGFNFTTDFNTAFSVGDGGFLNLTLGYYKQQETNRAGTPGIKDLPADARPNEIEWAKNNPDLGMHVGQPNLDMGNVFVNFSYPIGENSEFYTFHGFTSRYGQSYAYYRAPYWRRDVADSGFITRPEDFQGYQPTFETAIKDNIDAIGVKFGLSDKWSSDISLTYGGNRVDYTVNNSVNRDYLHDHGTSPRSFNPGGYSLSNLVGNFDVIGNISDMITLATGLEYKKEFFKGFEGGPLSYYGAGSDSFAGIKPHEAGEWDRNSFAAYAQLDFDITDAFLLGAAGRYEDYSDVDGGNFSWKVNGRFKLGEAGAIRASYSTGFRAPTLHQRYLTNSQYIIVAGSSEPLLQGTLANDSPAVQGLGVPKLTYETSNGIAAGITYKFGQNFFASVDFYSIKVRDRVLFSSQIGYKGGSPGNPTNPVEDILDENGVVAVQFFINAGDTKTTGADIVFNYDSHTGFKANLAANFNKTTIDAINTPPILEDAGYNIFDRQEQGLIINSRPKSKFILSLDYKLNNWQFGLYNTLFGKVTVTHPEGAPDDAIDQDLSPKLVNDLLLSYNFTPRLSITAMVNNMFNVYPDETDPKTYTSQAAHRFIYSSEVQQLGQLGRNYTIGFRWMF